MGYYEDIRNRFGDNSVRLLKQWAHNNTKVAKYENRKDFLLKCRRSGITPRHIQHNIRSLTSSLDEDNNGNNREIMTFEKKI